MALPTLDATFASSADLPRKQMLAKWLVNLQYSGSIEDYYTLPEKYLYAKIAVAAGASRSESDYISLPDRYVWSDIYKAVSGSSVDAIDRGEKEALGWIAAAVRGDTADPAKVSTYISWPWRYQVASIITSLAVDLDAQSFVTTSGATDTEGIDQFVKGVKNLGLWESMVCWPLRSTQNAGIGTTAFSLGGLGTFNGTLVNGPTWGLNGVTFDGTNDRIENAALTDNAQGTLFVSAYTDTLYSSLFEGRIASFSGGIEIGATRIFDNLGIEAFYLSSPFNGAGRGVVAASPVLSRWFSAQAVFTNSSKINRYIDGADKQSALFASTYTSKTGFSLGRRTGGDQLYWNGQISFGAYFSATLSDAQVAAMHLLYRDTLGTGLGLP